LFKRKKASMTLSRSKLIVDEIAHIDDPASAFEGLTKDSMPFLLESAMEMERYGRYSIMGANPIMAIKTKGSVIEIIRNRPIRSNSRTRFRSKPLQVVGEAVKQICSYGDKELSWLPFTGGAVGYFGYDLNRQIEKIPNLAIDDQGIPDICLGFYSEAIIIDHKERRSYAVALVLDHSNRPLREAKSRLNYLVQKIQTAKLGRLSSGRNAKAIAKNLSSNFNRKQYTYAIEKAKDYISAGDIFQVNLAQRFTVDLMVDHYSLYKRLRKQNPAPFAAFLGYGDFSILSSSPERFMFVDGRHVETRPIKGTRPRYGDMQMDKESINELIKSEKDAAEHVMIVDVERNDLGRVCEFGSIRVPDLMVVESYSTVHHLVSTVVGKLRPDIGLIDLIQASFPGGSITGAPKIRAMEIIEELEPCRRNVYTGSIGYISTNGKMDLNIAIRTITAINSKAYLQVGGGIVADSNPKAEYEETLDKGRAMFSALGLVV